VYGAERRGAAITAFTRIDRAPILERGLIDRPDLIVLGDETLFNDATAGVLSGQDVASCVFVNADAASEMLAEKHSIRPPLITFDVTKLTMNVLGKASALSAGLGAVAARLLGVIPEDRLIEAVGEELHYLGLTSDLIDKNVQIAKVAFAALHPVDFQSFERQVRTKVVPIGYDDPLLGSPSIIAAGNADHRHTGSWRLERPEIDYDRCTRCGMCFIRCPDGTISLDSEGYPAIDFDHCKGCGICWQVCPVSGIERRKEVRAW
jgi:pyruvate ferredoxin oxidoreductase gamma subunit